MRTKLCIMSLAIGCVLLLSSCVTPNVGLNKLYPPDRTFAPGELSTLIVAYPFVADSVDDEKIENVGDYDSVIELPPGEHKLTTHMDTRGMKIEGLTESYKISDSGTLRFMAKPGWIHIIRLARDKGSYGENDPNAIISVMTGGPHPFHTPDGSVISFEFQKMKTLAKVTTGQAQKDYRISARHIFYSWDATHLAFFSGGQKWVLVRDGIEKEGYKSLSTICPQWSIDGEHFAFVIYEGLKTFVIVDGKRIGPYKSLLSDAAFFFDLDGKLTYGVKLEDGWYMVRGDENIKMAGEREVYEAIEKRWTEYSQAMIFY